MKTKQNLDNKKYTQESGDTLTLSGTTNVEGTFELKGVDILLPEGYTGETITIGEEVVFNGNRTITRAGFPAVNVGFSGSVEEYLEKLLFVDVAPSAGISASNTTREIGSSTSVALSWSVTKNSNLITAITVAGDVVTPTGYNQAGTASKNTAPDTNTTFSISVTDSTGLAGGASVGINYLPARYRGSSATTPAAMKAALQDGSNIDAGALGFTKELSSNYVNNNNYDCTGGEYIYILYPASFGIPSNVTSGGFAFSAFNVDDVTIKDIYGISRNYKLLYTGLQNGNAVNINIIN